MDLVSELQFARQATLKRYAMSPESELNEARAWEGAPSSLRFHLSWLSEGGENRRVRILRAASELGYRFTEAQLAVLELGRARGRLLGSLIGLSDSDLDRAPAEGDWSGRRVLGHVVATDIRYEIAVRHALNRARQGGAGPLRPDEALLPAREGEAESTGSPAELRDRLRSAHWSVLQTLTSIPDDLLAAPTAWVSWDVEVRFRVHRFAAHDREHTIQIEKVRKSLGFQMTEAQLLLADSMVELGALEALLVCMGDDLIDRTGEGGEPSIATVLGDSLIEEEALASA
jgi:hypothetical protein